MDRHGNILAFSFFTIVSFFLSCSPDPTINNDQNEVRTIKVRKESDSIRKYENGEVLFKRNCSMCHFASDKKLSGPGLRGVENRLPAPAEDYFIKYTLNNYLVFKSGDSYAKKMKEGGWSGMPTYDGILTVQEVQQIYSYVVNGPVDQKE